MKDRPSQQHLYETSATDPQFATPGTSKVHFPEISRRTALKGGAAAAFLGSVAGLIMRNLSLPGTQPASASEFQPSAADIGQLTDALSIPEAVLRPQEIVTVRDLGTSRLQGPNNEPLGSDKTTTRLVKTPQYGTMLEISLDPQTLAGYSRGMSGITISYSEASQNGTTSTDTTQISTDQLFATLNQYSPSEQPTLFITTSTENQYANVLTLLDASFNPQSPDAYCSITLQAPVIRRGPDTAYTMDEEPNLTIDFNTPN